MFLYCKPWKSFSIDIPSFCEAVKTAVPSFTGANGTGRLELIFSQALTFEQKEAIDDLWDGLTQQGEATKRARQSRLTGQAYLNFIETKKQQAAALDWNAMSAAQRKLAMGASLTAAELDTL